MDPTSLTDVQWQMSAAPGLGCSADFSIDDVSFVALGPAPEDECPVFVPTSVELTDSIASVAAPWASYAFAAPGLAAPVVTPLYGSDSSWQALQVDVDPGVPTDPDDAWLGFGVPDQVVARDDNSVECGGACADELCLAPRSEPLAIGDHEVLFTDLARGNPNPMLDASQINDLGWELTAPIDSAVAPCVASLQISQVRWLP